MAAPLKTPLEPVGTLARRFDPSLQDQPFLPLPVSVLIQRPRRRRGRRCSADWGAGGGRGYHPPGVEADALGLVGVEGWVVIVDGPAAQEAEVFLERAEGA